MQLPLRARRWSRHTVALVSASLVLSMSLLLLLLIAQAGRVLPGTTVIGVDVGGRDPWSAQRILTPALEREQRRTVAVSAPGQRLQVRPIDAGVRFDTEATAARAFARGRGGATQTLARLVAGLTSVSIVPHAVIDEAALGVWLEAAAQRIERDPSVGDLRIDRETLTVDTIGPHGAIVVDREASLERLRAALIDPAITRVELVTRTTQPPAPWSAIEELAGQVDRALGAPVTLHHEGRRLVIDQDVLARLVTITTVPAGAGMTPAIAVPPRLVQQLLGVEGRATFDSSAEDARLITPATPPVALAELSSIGFAPVPTLVTVIPGRSQATFFSRLIADQLVDLITTGARTAEAALLVVPPDVTTEAAEEGRPTHLLGTFTTFHPAGPPRTANIRLLADLLDDQLIPPGETFSINGTSGPRRCEDGFVPAGTIIRGELVDTCGGGVSQFGTTLMNAAFFAGLELEQWQAHSFFISRYPAGREATLSYPDLDVRFRNDTDGYVVLRTSHTPDSITVSLYGRPRWQQVRAMHGERRAPTDFTETLRPTTDLRPGARRVVQSGGGGFTITVTRTRTPVDETRDPVTERWTTVYRPQQRIVEVGVAPSAVSPGDAPGDAAPPAAAGAASDG